MRIYEGITLADIPDPESRDFIQRLRGALWKIDYWARDASAGFGRISLGENPDGSGDPLGGDVDGGVFFRLPGRPGGQVGHGGTGDGSSLTLSSTASGAKGKIYLGESQAQSAYDEANGRLGIGTVAPATPLHVVGEFNGITTYTITSDLSYVSGEVGVGKAVDETATIYSLSNLAYPDLATAGDGRWMRIQNDANSRTITLGLSVAVSDNTTYTITYSAKNEQAPGPGPNAATQIVFGIVTAGKKRYAAAPILPASAWTSSFATYTATVVCDGSAGSNGALVGSSIEFGESASVGTGTYSAFEYAVVTFGSQVISTIVRADDHVGGTRFTVNSEGATKVDLATDVIGLTVEGASGQSVHLQNWSNSVPTVLSFIDFDGTFNGPLISSSSSFVDSGFRIVGSGDPLKKLAFEVDGFATTPITRTLTPQDADYIVAGTNIVNTFVAGQTFFNSAPATPSLPAIIMQHSGGGTGDLLHLRSSGGVTNFLIDQTALVWDWVPTSGQVTFQIGPGAFSMVDNSNRTMMSLTTGSTAYWSDAVSSGVYELFGANPDGKRVVIHNNGGIFSRLGFSATGFVIDNNASGVVHAPSSNGMVEIWNRANASKIALRLVLHPSQSAPGFVVRDSNDQKSYFSVGVLTNVGPSIFNNPFSGVGHGDTPIRIYVDTAADATNGLTYTMLDLYDVAGNQQMIWALDGAGAAGVLVFPTRGGLSVVSPAALTTGRVPFADANGDLTDDADLTFATDTLTVTKIAATTFTGNITLSTKNIVTDAATGTKIGTATTQLLGLWNAAPIAQPTTGIAASTFVTNTSLIANDSATWDGYTVGQVVKALRNFGLLA